MDRGCFKALPSDAVSGRSAFHVDAVQDGREEPGALLDVTGGQCALILEGALPLLDAVDAKILSHHTIDPTRGYWRTTQREPGGWPGSRWHMT